MKQKSLLTKSLLLAAFMVGGVNSVLAQDVTYTLEKVTSVEAGSLYVFEQSGHVMNNSVSSSALQTTETYKTDGLEGTESYVWTLEASDTHFKMRNVSLTGSQYLTNSSKTTVSFNSTGSKWDFNFQEDGTVLIQNSENSNRFLGYSTSTSYAYKAYATSNLDDYSHAINVYKLVAVDPTAPVINADGITPAYNASSGTISYTVENAVDGATVSASANVDWITNIAVNATDKEVTFDLAKNVTAADRAGKVTLTYTKDATELATKEVTVTQGHLDVAAPTFSVSAGTYNEEQSVELATETGDATIYYTTDGSTPTTGSSVYSSAIAVSVSMTIKAIAVKDEVRSSVAEATYTLQVATPTISPNGGAFEDEQDVTISCVTDDAAIYYTNDESTPTSTSTAYAAFTLTATTTIKAIATKVGWADSEVASATFTKVDLSNVFVKTGLSAIASDDVIAIVGDNGKTYAMPNDNGTSNAPDAVEVTVASNMISSVGDNLKWNVSGNATDGYMFCKNGVTTSGLYCTNTNNGVRVGTVGESGSFEVKSGYLYNKATSRYIGIYNSQDWRCYSTNGGNIIDQTFAIYKQGISMTLASACTDGVKYYGTFSSSVPFKFPAGVTVSEIAIADGKLKVVDYAAGAVVPANTGVLVSSATAGKVTFTPTAGAGTSVLGEDNCLKASGFDLADATTAGMDCKFYRLTMHNGTELGFWWGAEDGAAFSIAANKAYLAVPTSALSAPVQGFVFGDETTGVKAIDNGQFLDEPSGEAERTMDNCYNLSGQRVSQPTRGLYIKNGRKYIVK